MTNRMLPILTARLRNLSDPVVEQPEEPELTLDNRASSTAVEDAESRQLRPEGDFRGIALRA